MLPKVSQWTPSERGYLELFIATYGIWMSICGLLLAAAGGRVECFAIGAATAVLFALSNSKRIRILGVSGALLAILLCALDHRGGVRLRHAVHTMERENMRQLLLRSENKQGEHLLPDDLP